MMNKTELVTSPHRHDGSTVLSVMSKVCLALVPGVLCYAWYFGPGILIQCVLAVIFALAIEAVLLKTRKRNLSLHLKDGSVVVTALIFALMISPYTPWWVSLLGLAFGLVFAKHIYGGLGHNLFNPAAAAYIFVLLCFPVYMSKWPAIETINTEISVNNNVFRSIFSSPLASTFAPAGQGAADVETNYTGPTDSVSGATVLADMQNRLASMAMISEIQDSPIYGNMAGTGWEWINMGYLVGGIGLLFLGVISWHIPVTVLGSLLFISLVFNLNNPDIYASSLFHLFAGGSILGAFFVATDPVSASSTPRGKLIYGCLIGMLAYIIRIWGAYPDGIAFAVLIANSFVPLIDKFTRPKVLGEY
jgi:Na+-translocating ferredoxin:NAD+ oxidoreductase subunit D